MIDCALASLLAGFCRHILMIQFLSWTSSTSVTHTTFQTLWMILKLIIYESFWSKLLGLRQERFILFNPAFRAGHYGCGELILFFNHRKLRPRCCICVMGHCPPDQCLRFAILSLRGGFLSWHLGSRRCMRICNAWSFIRIRVDCLCQNSWYLEDFYFKLREIAGYCY